MTQSKSSRCFLRGKVKPQSRLRDLVALLCSVMSNKIVYDVYRGTSDPTLRLATMPGAGLPAHVKRKEWVLMPTGKSPLHSDVDRDVSGRGYCFFQLVDDRRPA